MNINELERVNPNNVYLVAYYNSDQLIEFDKSVSDLKNFLVLGGPVPIKSLPVEIGVTIYYLPEDSYSSKDISDLGGYLAKGIFVTLPIKRNI
jgi:hypothetical protein